MRPILIAGVALASFSASAAGKHHVLKATPESVQWGWLDPSEPPKLTIDSGDTVSIETLLHARDQIQMGVSMEKIVELRKANPGGGPHSITGPIAVNGAEPGDVLEIRILKIVPKKTGFNFNLPGKEFPTIGALAQDYPQGYVKYFDIDPKAKPIRFKPGIEIPVRPFPGTLAGGIDPDDPSPRKGGAKEPLAPVSTLRPWKNGSNMDINEMTEGTTIFIPVFLKLTWPRIETKTHFIQVGFDEDLMKAFTIALNETVDFLTTSKGLDRYEAYSLASIAADCRVSQVVDVRKGVHCMVPKSIFTAAKATTR